MTAKERRVGHPAEEIVGHLLTQCDELLVVTGDEIPQTARRRVEENVSQLIEKLNVYLQGIHPVRQPTFIFDVGNPEIIGRFVALALVAQPRIPLANIDRFYGSGVYALYYNGDFSNYYPIRGMETPIYVGKADPDSDNARSPQEQGEKLAGRLKDHRRNIKKAVTTLNIDDFSYRCLVVQSGWQQAAENFLISLFRPIWNNETNICYGLGKHGDDPGTRGNRRSPWDTMHPGRDWAYRDPTMEDAIPKEQIEILLAEHLRNAPIYRRLEDVFRDFIEGLRQL